MWEKGSQFDSDETFLHVSRVSGVILLLPLVFLCIAVMPVLFLKVAESYLALILKSAIAIGGLSTIVLAYICIMHYYTFVCGLTNRRIVARSGFFNRKMIDMENIKVESIEVDQGPLGRFLDYGTLKIRGTGTVLITFNFISAPYQLAEEFNNLK